MPLSRKIAMTAVAVIVSLIVVFAWLRKNLDDNAAFLVSTTKVCQVTGVEDRERPGKSTGQVSSGVGAGVTGSDLGYPFEHGQRLFFLFGDTREIDPDLCEPSLCGTTTAPKAPGAPGVHRVGSPSDWTFRTRERDGADSIASAPIQSDPQRCLPLKFDTDPPDQLGDRFHALTLDGKILGRFETPVSGFSDGGQTIYAFFSLRDTPPGCTLNGGCALGDAQPGGQARLAFSSDQGRSFKSLWTVSRTKFQWPVPVIVEAKQVPGLPPELAQAGKVLLIFGTGREHAIFRFSYPYLAVASLEFFGVQGSWKYYANTDASGAPVWSSNEADARELPPFGSPRFERDPKYGPGYHRCIGEFSVQYDSSLNKWLMLYACSDNPQFYNPHNGRGIFLRMADAPWGPWSMPRLVLDPGSAYCHFMHAQDPSGCAGAPNPADLGARDGADANKNAWGGEYAAFLLPSRYYDYTADRLTLYFVMSTWNPYQVVQMKTVLRKAVWWKRALTSAEVLQHWVP